VSHRPVIHAIREIRTISARMKRFHLHLVSDATGETINAVARAAVAQFKDVEAIEHFWFLVRSSRQIDEVLSVVAAKPGIVLFTIVDRALRRRLENGCRRLRVPSVHVLEPVIAALSGHVGVKAQGQPGLQHALDDEYFSRIDAIQFVLGHDDGQMVSDLENADVVLVGVSRTSKTPTCFYLANRGIKAANIPVVPGAPVPSEVERLTHPLVVGLTIAAERLIAVRRNRLGILEHLDGTDYVNPERVADEVLEARRLFAKHGWPVIDVTRRSIEEVAAAILQQMARRLNGDVSPSNESGSDGASASS
jgi:[pyruvate, water dikinase]-phosphate phosphotransferase / [pyruvate, water dikinase] kinase